MSLPVAKEKPAGFLDMSEEPLLKLPPEGDVLPPGSPSFNVSEMSRDERRKLGRKHGFKIVGTNRPIRKEKQ